MVTVTRFKTGTVMDDRNGLRYRICSARPYLLTSTLGGILHASRIAQAIRVLAPTHQN